MIRWLKYLEVSYEIMQKSYRAGKSTLISRSTPIKNVIKRPTVNPMIGNVLTKTQVRRSVNVLPENIK